MTLVNFLRRCERGAAAIEFALVVPILVLFIYGIFQVGLLFQASAGMQHALGEGARYATLCIPTGTGCNTRTDAELVTRMSNKVFGMNIGTFSTPTVTTPATAPMHALQGPDGHLHRHPEFPVLQRTAGYPDPDKAGLSGLLRALRLAKNAAIASLTSGEAKRSEK